MYKNSNYFGEMIGLLVVLLFVCAPNVNGGAFSTQFRIIHEAILKCPSTGTDDIIYDVHLFKKDRKNVRIKGNFTYKIPFDDNVAIRAKFWSWGNGGWKSGSGVDFARDDGCTALSWVIGPVWTAMADSMKSSRKCPVKPGHYYMNDFDSAVWNKIPIPGVPLNRFKLELSFLKRGTKKVLGCYSSVVNVIKKP